MIFKEIDLMELDCIKSFEHSSLSKKGCDDNNFVFYTGFEEQPCIKIELKDEVFLDYIKIQDLNSSYIKIEISKDDKKYCTLDKDFMEFQNKTNTLIVNIEQRFSFKYLRVSLQGFNCLYFKNIKFLKRKHDLLIVGSGGAFGDRFIAFLNAMYLAEINNMKFLVLLGLRLK